MPRHNRRRTRSRPRHRKSNSISLGYANPLQHSASWNQSGLAFNYQLAPAAYNWHTPIEQQTQGITSKALSQVPNSTTAAAEAHRLRIFGGEVGDDVSLCDNMLQVVLDLFDGGLDYADP